MGTLLVGSCCACSRLRWCCPFGRLFVVRDHAAATERRCSTAATGLETHAKEWVFHENVHMKHQTRNTSISCGRTCGIPRINGSLFYRCVMNFIYGRSRWLWPLASIKYVFGSE